MSIEQASSSPAKVVECVAYQCAECDRKHTERSDAERCCRCLRCRTAKLPPGSIGHCDACFAALCDSDDDLDDDDWEDDDE